MTVGDRIKQRRLELGLSVDDLASKLNKNRATVYRYESNDIENFPTSTLEPLAKALGTTPAYLMGWEEQTSFTKEDSFNYFLEMQLRLMGYEIIYEEEDFYTILRYEGHEYEIDDKDINELSSATKSFVDFKLHEIMKHSRLIGGKKKVTRLSSKAYLEPVAAHERTDIEVTDEMRKHDDDLMDNDDLWDK